MRTPLTGAVVAALLLALPAAAKDPAAAGPYPAAVQNRTHTQRHEFGAWVGTLPMDAFTKGLTFSGAYTYHFNDLFAWEIAQFTYSVPIDTRLKEELANLPEPVGPTPFEIVRYYGTSNFVFKPLYGKLAWLNRGVLHVEGFLVVGGGFGRLTLTSRPVVDAGLGARLYSSRHLSFRVELRDYVFFNLDDVENEIWVAVGLSLAFGGQGG